MEALWQHLRTSLRLYFRNTMALIYGYIFPTIFLVVFWVLYRYEQVPLLRHMGEVLTITVLGGACFGLPTTLVSERERGVWRRYRLAPLPTGTLVASTVIARYVLLLSAGLLQVALAMAAGMPLPRHPIDLFVAFTCVAFAFMGLGLVIAMLADNVPAVQALGQCLFLPMLVIGGVAVPLASLPEWAQHVSAFLPGRYAVQALQATVNGDGLQTQLFNLVALLAIGASACVAAVRMFRWDAQQRFVETRGKGWIAAAVGAWLLVGTVAESRGRVTIIRSPDSRQVSPDPIAPRTPAAPGPAAETNAAAAAAAARPSSNFPVTLSAPERAQQPRPDSAPVPAPQAAPSSAPPPATAAPATGRPGIRPASWLDVTLQDVDEEIAFERLPPDNAVVTPIAESDQQPDAELVTQLAAVRDALPRWEYARADDPVQKVRNHLFIAGAVDVFQLPLEPYLPLLLLEQLQRTMSDDELTKILFWIALHPREGSDAAARNLGTLGLPNATGDLGEVRGRVGIYAVKLLGRVTGRRPGR